MTKKKVTHVAHVGEDKPACGAKSATTSQAWDDVTCKTCLSWKGSTFASTLPTSGDVTAAASAPSAAPITMETASVDPVPATVKRARRPCSKTAEMQVTTAGVSEQVTDSPTYKKTQPKGKKSDKGGVGRERGASDPTVPEENDPMATKTKKIKTNTARAKARGQSRAECILAFLKRRKDGGTIGEIKAAFDPEDDTKFWASTILRLVANGLVGRKDTEAGYVYTLKKAKAKSKAA